MIDNKAIFNISYGLFVLVARQGDKDNACIINVAQQVTSDPLQLMICVNKQNLTHDMILRTLKFNLCPLCFSSGFFQSCFYILPRNQAVSYFTVNLHYAYFLKS